MSAPITVEHRLLAMQLMGVEDTRCGKALITGDWSPCSCGGRGAGVRDKERAARFFAELDAVAEDRERRKERTSVLNHARRQNYGPTLRTFAKQVSRGYHEDAEHAKERR